MELTYDFIRLFVIGLGFVSPLLLLFVLIIIVLGLIIGKREGWTRLDALYFAFISATTVGFGDFQPKEILSKLLTITIAMVGLVFTGIVIAIALHAATYAFEQSPEFTKVIQLKEQFEGTP
jgi:voltage-gated potassium channel